MATQKRDLIGIIGEGGYVNFFLACENFAIGVGGRVQSEAGWGVCLGGRGGIALPPDEFFDHGSRIFFSYALSNGGKWP